MSAYCSDPVTEILGGPDMFVDLGSTINLTCVARFTPGQPEYVKWFHGNKVRFIEIYAVHAK